MIIDTSAIVCLLKDEPLAPRILLLLTLGLPNRVSAATLSELFAVVIRSIGADNWAKVDRLISRLNIEIVAYNERQFAVFRDAYRQYGRGGHNHSKARLNLGDCFSYALAKTAAEPLLFVGDDFTHTDIIPALKHYDSSR